MIQPEFKSLIVILNDKLFRIPEYQRHYSWQPKQRRELLEDIEKLQEAREKYDDRVHFMATIVCLNTKEKRQVGSNTFYTYDVVDGQQRLTTLIILLKAISIRPILPQNVLTGRLTEGKNAKDNPNRKEGKNGCSQLDSGELA